jgi:hypothetical protein
MVPLIVPDPAKVTVPVPPVNVPPALFVIEPPFAIVKVPPEVITIEPLLVTVVAVSTPLAPKVIPSDELIVTAEGALETVAFTVIK